MSIALRFSRIEPGQRPQLLAEIRNILTEVGAHNISIYDEAYWKWQYEQLPTGKSLVYAAWDADRMIGYYHVPIYRFSINGKEKLIGNIQDVAVSPSYRGMGLFRKLAEFANLDIDQSEVDLIYTFPNNKSIRTFLKYNDFSTVCPVPAYLRPIRSSRIIGSKLKLLGAEKLAGAFSDALINMLSKNIELDNTSIEHIESITDEVVEVFTDFASRFQCNIIRDKEWLNWRYLRSVRGKHHLLGLRKAGKLTSVVVLKEDEMLGNPSLLLMDFAHISTEETSFLYLMDQIRTHPELTGQKFNLIFTSGIAPALASLKQIGFMCIPQKANPRVLNLLVRSSGSTDPASMTDRDNWLLTLGDWDVF